MTDKTHKPKPVAEPFDFAESFARTLQEWEDCPDATKQDFYRMMEKRND